MSDERDWGSATDDELQDGIDDGEKGAIIEYGSRLFGELFGELRRAKELLRCWARKANHPGLEYETVAFLDGPEAARALKPVTPEESPR